MEPGSSRRPGRSAAPGLASGARRGPGLSLTLAEPRWRSAVRGVEARARRAAAAAVRAARLRGAVTLLLADDATLGNLNARHRGKDYATNVLSFPGPDGGGDLAIALGVVRREARAMRVPVASHLAHLVVHGTLHLAGRDHDTDHAARRMEREEAAVLRRLGIADPYRSRR
ncbi:MAG: rRNA maturation RNase YbeY [Acetobacteraceae bacterium]|jgi:probable rRNA maturation factor|nr:rRNA maturation RNase YbeY [Acetobacteraceae bacterium]